MVDPDDDKESIVRRLRGSQRVLVVLIVGALLLSGAAGVAVAFSEIDPFEWTYAEDFEDGDRGNWSAAGSVVTNSYQETYSYSVDGGDTGTLSQPEINVVGGETIRTLYMSVGSGVSASNIKLQMGNDNEVIITDIPDGNDMQLSTQDPQGGSTVVDSASVPAGWKNIEWTTNETYSKVWVWEPGSDKPDTPTMEGDISQVNISTANLEVESLGADDVAYVDEIGITGVPPSGVEGTVTDEEGTELSNVTVEASQNGTDVANGTTNDLGQYELSLENGTYNVTASMDGYFPQTEMVEVKGGIVEQNFQLRNHSAALTIDTRPFLEHGESAPYSVVYESRNGSDARLMREDVTDNSTVTSGDTGIITVNTATERIEATDDRSVNNRTFLTAEYTTGGETYTTQQNVTVANETVDNLGILPPVNRFTASLSGGTDANPNDKTIMLLIIGASAGAAASLIATSFAGVAALTMVMMLGWIMGMTSDGMAIVTIFIALFVGLNVAGNVDYTVRR